VRDAQGNLVQGRTRWRRFAAVLLPATAIAGAIVIGMANGAIAASFAVSGSTFKLSADRLEATGFAQYGGFASENGARGSGQPVPDMSDPRNHPVAVSAISSATITNLCQSVLVPLPGAPIVLRIEAGGGGSPAEATTLLIDMEQLSGNAEFTNIQIGQDASTLTKGGGRGLPGQFGQQADRVVITNLRQVAWSTSAGTFKLNGLNLRVYARDAAAGKECF
jgi:hypothetical protein